VGTSVLFYQTREVTGINLPSLQNGSVAFINLKAASIELPSLTTANGIKTEYCGPLVNISFPVLQSMKNMQNWNCNNLVNIDMPMLETVREDISFRSSPKIVVSFPKLVSIGEVLELRDLTASSFLRFDVFRTKILFFGGNTDDRNSLLDNHPDGPRNRVVGRPPHRRKSYRQNTLPRRTRYRMDPTIWRLCPLRCGSACKMGTPTARRAVASFRRRPSGFRQPIQAE
jgi:hypothetical protein